MHREKAVDTGRQIPYPVAVVLYHHQRTGAEWLAERRAAMLCDEQGLGKTITAIVAAERVKARRVLVLAPTIVLWNWRREFESWAPWRRVQLLDTSRARIDEQAEVVVTTHGLMIREAIRAQLLRWAPDVLVVDEAHCFRTPSAKRTRVLFGVPGRDDVPALVRVARRVWLMTGTPAPNNASELWAPLWGLWPEAVPSTFTAFRNRYCVTAWTPYGDGVKVVGNRNAVELRGVLAGKMLRRTKAEYLDLPPVRHESIALRPSHSDVVEAIDRELTPELRAVLVGTGDPTAALEALRDSEAMSRWRRLCGLAKATAAGELLAEELRYGGLQKVVVFAHHTDVVLAVRDALTEFGAVAVTGSTPAAVRSRHADAFQRDARVRVFVANIVAGGTGVTLTAAADAVFVELSWVPGENAQAADRVHRIGQTAKGVRVRFVSLAGSVDEFVVEALRNKLRMIREVLS